MKEEVKAKRQRTNADVVMDDRFESLRSKNKSKQLRRRIFSVIIALMLSMVFLTICASLFLRIRQVNITGSEFYDDAAILETSGVETMQNLYAINKQEIESAIMTTYPYIKNVTITRQLPTTLSFLIEEDLPAYYVEIAGEYFILSDSLRVLELCTGETEAKIRSDSIRRLVAPQIIYAVVGQDVRFSGNSMFAYTSSMLAELSKTTLFEKVSEIDISDKFSIILRYDNRFDVMMGNNQDIRAKASFAMGMIESFSEEASGLINAENVESGYAIVDKRD